VGCSVLLRLMLGMVLTALTAAAHAADTAPLPVNFEAAGDFGGKGTGSGKFQYPQGMAVDHNGSIHVVDNTNKRVQVFREQVRAGVVEYVFDRAYGTKTRDAQPFFPSDVALDSLGNAYLSEYGDRISVYDQFGKYWRGFSTELAGERPWNGGLYVDRTSGNVVVTGAPGENGRISIWTPEGKLQRVWNAHKPCDVWIPREGGILFVAAWDRVSTYDTSGNLRGEFDTPSGAVSITGDEAGRVYVTFKSANEVRAYSTRGNLLGAYALPGGPIPAQPYSGDHYSVVYAGGFLFATDRVNHKVVRLKVVPVAPSAGEAKHQ